MAFAAAFNTEEDEQHDVDEAFLYPPCRVGDDLGATARFQPHPLEGGNPQPLPSR